MNPEKELILQKIKKLLDLSDPKNGGSIGELQNSAVLAQKLLSKYHLSVSQVLSLDSKKSNGIEIVEEEAVKYVANILPDWLRILIEAINNITDTKTLIKRSERENTNYGYLGIYFVGDNLDVLTAIELFNFLKSTISKMATQIAKKDNNKQSYQLWKAFSKGCVDAILIRSYQIESEINNSFSNLDIDSRIIFDDDENVENSDDDGDDDDDISEEEPEYNIQLYKQYQDTKFLKIKEYVEQLDYKAERPSSKSNKKLETNSYFLGQKYGETIPLTISKKLSEQTKKR